MYATTLYVLFINVCMYEAFMVTTDLPVGCNEVGFISTISVDGVTTDATGSNHGSSIGRHVYHGRFSNSTNVFDM